MKSMVIGLWLYFACLQIIQGQTIYTFYTLVGNEYQLVSCNDQGFRVRTTTFDFNLPSSGNQVACTCLLYRDNPPWNDQTSIRLDRYESGIWQRLSEYSYSQWRYREGGVLRIQLTRNATRTALDIYLNSNFGYWFWTGTFRVTGEEFLLYCSSNSTISVDTTTATQQPTPLTMTPPTPTTTPTTTPRTTTTLSSTRASSTTTTTSTVTTTPTTTPRTTTTLSSTRAGTTTTTTSTVTTTRTSPAGGGGGVDRSSTTLTPSTTVTQTPSTTDPLDASNQASTGDRGVTRREAIIAGVLAGGVMFIVVVVIVIVVVCCRKGGKRTDGTVALTKAAEEDRASSGYENMAAEKGAEGEEDGVESEGLEMKHGNEDKFKGVRALGAYSAPSQQKQVQKFAVSAMIANSSPNTRETPQDPTESDNKDTVLPDALHEEAIMVNETAKRGLAGRGYTKLQSGELSGTSSPSDSPDNMRTGSNDRKLEHYPTGSGSGSEGGVGNTAQNAGSGYSSPRSDDGEADDETGSADVGKVAGSNLGRHASTDWSLHEEDIEFVGKGRHRGLQKVKKHRNRSTILREGRGNHGDSGDSHGDHSDGSHGDGSGGEAGISAYAHSSDSDTESTRHDVAMATVTGNDATGNDRTGNSRTGSGYEQVDFMSRENAGETVNEHGNVYFSSVHRMLDRMLSNRTDQ